MSIRAAPRKEKKKGAGRKVWCKESENKVKMHWIFRGRSETIPKEIEVERKVVCI